MIAACSKRSIMWSWACAISVNSAVDERLELVGEPERTASSFVAGVKHLPVRYRFAR